MPAVAKAVEAALFLTIAGVMYSLARSGDAAWTMQKVGAEKSYRVQRHPNGLLTCDCPAYAYRRICKHIRSLQKVKLL
jgi:hypothetical protein